MEQQENNQAVKSGIRKVNVDTLNLKSRGRGKKKVRPSLFDNPQDRSYWKSDQKGIDLEICLTKTEIRRSLKKGVMLDVKNSRTASHLNKEHIFELMEYQFKLMLDIASEDDTNIFVDEITGNIVMVDFNCETNQYEFVFSQ